MVMAVVIMRLRSQRQPQSAIRQDLPPATNNPAFDEPVYAVIVDAAEAGTFVPPQAPQYEIPVAHNPQCIGPGVAPQAPQYDTVGFVRDQYAALGPHSTYDSADTEA